MTEVWTIYGGDMWRQVFNGVVTIIGSDTFSTLKRIVGLFGVLGVMFSFIKSRNPMVFLHWVAIFFVITSVLLVPKRSVQIIDITDPAAVYEVDNVPAGLAAIAGLATGAGFGVAQLYDYALARPDSLTYTKSGMLFGSQVVAQSSDFRTQNPQLAQMLTDYVENCVVGDILLNNKYTVAQLLNSTDPLTLITSNPSPLRGLYQDAGGGRQFITCQQAAVVIQNLIGSDISIGGTTWHALATRLFGSRVDANALLSSSMDDSYNFFYAGGLSASQIMRNNVTNAAIRDGWKGFAARSSDTASHTDNQSASQAQQFAATLNDAKSQYHQYTESSTRSQEFSRMATLSQTQSASLDANYNQEFVDWTTAKYGSDAQNILTNVRSAQGAATEFMHERLEPEIMRNYGARTDQVSGQPLQPTRSLDAPDTQQSGDARIQAGSPVSGPAVQADESQGDVSGNGRATAENVHHRERNLSVPTGAPSQAMTDDFLSSSRRVSGEAAGAGIRSNVADKVAAQRSGLMETVRENDGKIAENKTTVQTSSDILRNEHQGAVKSQQIGRTEEDIRQTKPVFDNAETTGFEEKLQKLRAAQKKAS
ncbi:MAG: conjugal transfer protein TraG N-terminal domain-containing protein [Pantoea sp.]|uniref:conjugal transfer protein TraG N-terminal domain-containing protein n=1 Tax=Pantoea sp. TaxID=69393 RepID=UPI0039E379A8